MNRRISRVKAVQSLFQVDVSNTDKYEAMYNVIPEGETIDEFLEQLVVGTLHNLNEIDEILLKNLLNWKLERVGNVDRAILRMAIYEMKFMPDIPINVSLNEAIDLAKGFGGEESGRFFNGVLSKIAELIKTNTI